MDKSTILDSKFNEYYIKELLNFGSGLLYSTYKITDKNRLKIIKISFRRFRLFYGLNPDRYIMEKDLVKVKEDPNKDLYSIILEFSFFGNILYKMFRKTNSYIKKKKKDFEIKYNNTQEYLNLVNKDINKTKEYAKSYVDESKEIIDSLRRKNNV